MKTFEVVPKIVQLNTIKEFCEAYQIGEGDLLFVSAGTYKRSFDGLAAGAHVVDYRKYGKGEPTDLMVESICEDIKDSEYKRVIAVGGGTILDVAKLFALKQVSPVVDLFEKKIPAQREKELILVPTTCGTGSEVTNISILELTVRNTKFGLAVPELFADEAVLIPELLKELPISVFATSSIDALIHAIESFTSPKANTFTRMYSVEAMTTILNVYQSMAKEGAQSRNNYLEELLLASTYAGIAFSNAGCAAVHAMSYPLGAAYHVPHGESNYAMFTGVYKTYQKLNPTGSITALNKILSEILGCGTDEVYDCIETLLNTILPKKALREYGVTLADLDAFTETVMTKQGRLMANNYTELDRETVRKIYAELY